VIVCLHSSLDNDRAGQRLTLLFLLLWMWATTPVSAQAAELTTIPSITADRIKRDSRTGEIRSVDWLQLSPAGLRVRQTGIANNYEYLQSFTDDKLWLLDKARKLFTELEPRDDPDSVNQNPMISDFVASVGETPQSSLIAIEPCIDLDAEFQGQAKWRAQQVRVYTCHFAEGELYSKLFFSEKWGLVVREERVDQTTDEVVNIKDVDYGSGHFVPPNYYRKTDFQELVTGISKLRSYSK